MPKRKKRKSTKKKRRVVRRSKKKIKKLEGNEFIIKTKKEWINKALVNKSEYEKNIKNHLKIMMSSGEKKEKELHGLNLIKK